MATTDTIKHKLQDALNSNHRSHWKREIRTYPMRLNFACPICGDSEDIDTKKRGNIYFKNMWYKCFNCGSSMPITSFFNRMNVNLDPETYLEINDQIDEYKQQTSSTTALSDFNLDKILDIEQLTEQLNNNPQHQILKFGPAEKDSEIGQYLINERKINNLNLFYQAYYRINSKRIEPVLVNINVYENFILGFQLRNLKKNRKDRIFKIYNFEDLWNFFPEKTALLEEELLRYNKLSYCYNILNINFETPITLFEGYLDSVFFPNSIGLVGTNTDYSFLLDEALDVRFFFDNDKAGLKKTTEMLDKGYRVFLWDRFLKKLVKKYKDPDLMYFKLKKRITDLNALAKQIKNPHRRLNLEQYFSYDKLDLLQI